VSSAGRSFIQVPTAMITIRATYLSHEFSGPRSAGAQSHGVLRGRRRRGRWQDQLRGQSGSATL